MPGQGIALKSVLEYPPPGDDFHIDTSMARRGDTFHNVTWSRETGKPSFQSAGIRHPARPPK
jgi:hypothetical protein